jgi:hypothetical protein
LGIGAMIAATTMGVGSAYAGTARRADSFDVPSEWFTWKSGGTVGMSIGPTSGARTPSNAAGLLWYGNGTTSDWAMIGKTFFWRSTITGGPYPTYYGCSASVYLRGTIAPVKGQIELIDTIRGTYIGTKTFSLAASSPWTNVVVDNTYACAPWMTFRIVVPNTNNIQGLAADDVELSWGYYW